MAKGPLTRPFNTSGDHGPGTANHIMHRAYASNAQIGVLCMYGLAVAVAIVWFAHGLLPEVLNGPAGGIREWQLLQLAACAGALGGLIHMATSLARFVAFRDLERSWFLFYVFRPPVGAGLAVVVYFVLQTGLLSPVSSGSAALGDGNDGVYRILAFSSLTGLFARQAIEKLSEVFDVMFRTRTPESKPSPASEDVPGTGSGTGDSGTSDDQTPATSGLKTATAEASTGSPAEEQEESKSEPLSK